MRWSHDALLKRPGLLSLRKRKTENQVSSSPASISASGSYCNELFPIHHVDGWRSENPRARVELPKEHAGLCIVGIEVAGDIAAGPCKNEVTRSHQGTCLSIPFKLLLPANLCG